MRIAGIDLLRGVAAFGIVGCHLSLAPRTAGGELVTALCDFNVAMFAAVAGFLMCGRRGGGWLEYVGKRAKRLLPTYFFWSVVFIVATSVFDLLLDGGHLNPKYGTVSFWGKVIFAGDAATHLWFLVCLFYVQVVLHPIFVCCGGKWHGLMWIGIGGLLVCGSVMLSGWFGRYPLRLMAFLTTGYGIGCCFRSGVFDGISKCRWCVWCVMFLMLALYVLLGDRVPPFIKAWFTVGPVLLAFVMMDIKGNRFMKVATVLGATSMGVYLIHPLITRGLSVFVTRLFQPPYSAPIVLAEWLLAWAVSLTAAYVLGRMPIVRRFV